MFTPDFIFISITLFILSALAFKMNAPKVTIPFCIYMAFIINNYLILKLITLVAMRLYKVEMKKINH